MAVFFLGGAHTEYTYQKTELISIKKKMIASYWPLFADIPWIVSPLPKSADQVPVSVPPPSRHLLLIKAK